VRRSLDDSLRDRRTPTRPLASTKIGRMSATAVRIPQALGMLLAMRRVAPALALFGLVVACGPRPEPAPPPAAPPAPMHSEADEGLRFAELGTCALESGERIEECRIGYRTFGTLAPDRSNVVLFPTWFTGTTKALTSVVPGKLVDTHRFFLVLVDALGDGVSSSPSNSRRQPRVRFPRVTIHDMVEAQRRLVREVLGVTRLYAVAGISMGGMQTFEWAVAHPSELGRAVSIVGTPQLTSHDLLLWNAEKHALEADVAYAGGEYRGRPAVRAVQDIHWLMLSTPRHRAAETSRAEFERWVEEKERDTSFDWNDWRWQLEAMLRHDVARAHGGSLESAAKGVTAKMLVVVARHDHMVEPGPSEAFARALGARGELVVLDSSCGHLAPTEGCEAARLGTAVRGFLEE